MNTKTKLPQFKGKPLIEVPREIPQIGFLKGDFGKAFLEEYKGRVEADYKDSKVLNVLRYDNDVVEGSNPFAVVLANQILRQEGLRTATQADLEKTLRIGALDLRGYEDTGLALRSEGEPNTYLARNLMKQIKTRSQKQKMPVMIPLNRLELTIDSDSPYGIAFNLTDESEIIDAPILNESTSNFASEDIDEKTGLPKKLGEGNRKLYTRNSGLSRFFLGVGSKVYSMYSGDGDFSDSSDNGRVVVVSAEGT